MAGHIINATKQCIQKHWTREEVQKSRTGGQPKEIKAPQQVQTGQTIFTIKIVHWGSISNKDSAIDLPGGLSFMSYIFLQLLRLFIGAKEQSDKQKQNLMSFSNVNIRIKTMPHTKLKHSLYLNIHWKSITLPFLIWK